ncbi:MAG TPA: ABC transporter ATP-binding protein [Candidatus Eisenbacteria bacterium]
MNDAIAIETRGLTRRFGNFTAVDRLDLTIRAGEIFCFLGSNGAGKSTAIRMLCGLLRPTSGEARVLGIDVAARPEDVKRSIGYMSQRFSLYEDLSVIQNLHFYGGVYGLYGKHLDSRIEWALEMAGLHGKEQRLTADLPGGWKQRLALGCAVLHEPKVLFLDEPTGGVDPISRARFWDLIRDMAARGVTVMVTTHYMDEAEQCDRLALIHAGKLIALGTVEELRSVFAGQAVLEVVVDDYLGALERLEADPRIRDASVFGTRLHVILDGEPGAAEAVVRSILNAEQGQAAIRPVLPSLEDIFIHSIEMADAGNGAVAPAGKRS